MANEVYLLTHDGLSQMVSARAATRFLDKALDARSLSSDSVTSEDMREILQGPILSELRQILPKDGVERSIKQISRNLRKQAEKVAQAMLAVASAPAATDAVSLSGVSGDVLLTGEDELTYPTDEQVMSYEAAEHKASLAEANLGASHLDAKLGIINHTAPLDHAAPLEHDAFDTGNFDTGNFDAGEVERNLERTVSSTTLSSLAATPEAAAISVTTTNYAALKADAAIKTVAPDSIPADSIPANYSPEALAKMLVNFAQLEHVKVVAAVKPSGEISMSRGSGFDLDALSRLGSLGLKLLSRNRKINSYYLSQSRYQLFLFPLYGNTTSVSQTLIVVGSSDVNVGDVFSVRSHLEEDL